MKAMSKTKALRLLCLVIFMTPCAALHAAAHSPFQLLQSYGASGVTSLSFSPDSQQLLASHSDSRVCLWDYKQRKVLKAFFAGSVTQVMFMPDGAHFVAGYADGTMRLYTLSSDEFLTNFFNTGVSDPVGPMAISLDKTTLAIAAGNAAYVFDITTGTRLHALTGHTDKINGLAFSPQSTDGAVIGTASSDGMANIYDAATGNLKETISHNPATPLTSIAFFPAVLFGPAPYFKMATGGQDASVYITEYFPHAAYHVTVQKCKMYAPVTYLGFTISSSALTMAAFDGTQLQVNDFFSGQVLRSVSTLKSSGLGLLSPDYSVFAAANCTFDGSYALLFVDYASLQKTYTVPAPFLLQAGFTPVSDEVYTASQGFITFYDRMTGEEKRRIPGAWAALAMTRDGTKAYVAKDVVRVWDLSSNTEIRTFDECASPLIVFLSRDEKLLAAFNGGKAVVWNVESGECLGRFPHGVVGGYVDGVSFSPDGKQIVVAQDYSALWDIETSQKLWEQPGVQHAVFSGDGRHILGNIGSNAVLLSPDDGSIQMTFYPGASGEWWYWSRPLWSGNRFLTAYDGLTCMCDLNRVMLAPSFYQVHFQSGGRLLDVSEDGSQLLTSGAASAVGAGTYVNLWSIPSEMKFTKVPRGGLYQVGQRLELSVGVADAFGSPYYAWYKDDEVIDGANTDVLRVDPLALADSGDYTCIVGDAITQHKTPPASVTVFPPGTLPAVSLGGITVLASVLAVWLVRVRP